MPCVTEGRGGCCACKVVDIGPCVTAQRGLDDDLSLVPPLQITGEDK